MGLGWLVLAGHVAMRRAWAITGSTWCGPDSWDAALLLAFCREACSSQKQLVTSSHCSTLPLLLSPPLCEAEVRAALPVGEKAGVGAKLAHGLQVPARNFVGNGLYAQPPS